MVALRPCWAAVVHSLWVAAQAGPPLRILSVGGARSDCVVSRSCFWQFIHLLVFITVEQATDKRAGRIDLALIRRLVEERAGVAVLFAIQNVSFQFPFAAFLYRVGTSAWQSD